MQIAQFTDELTVGETAAVFVRLELSGVIEKRLEDLVDPHGILKDIPKGAVLQSTDAVFHRLVGRKVESLETIAILVQNLHTVSNSSSSGEALEELVLAGLHPTLEGLDDYRRESSDDVHLTATDLVPVEMLDVFHRLLRKKDGNDGTFFRLFYVE